MSWMDNIKKASKGVMSSGAKSMLKVCMYVPSALNMSPCLVADEGAFVFFLFSKILLRFHSFYNGI